MIVRLFFVLLPVFILFISPVYADSKNWNILVEPSGEEVQTGSQLIINFRRPMVALGMGERSVAGEHISVQPELQCDWHWLDTERLACDLSQKAGLKPATEYTVSIAKDISDFEGIALQVPQKFSFSTIRPALMEQHVRNWEGPGSPILLLRFNQPVAADELQSRIHFVLPDRSKINIVATIYPYNSKGDHWYVQPEKQLPLDTRIPLIMQAGFSGAEGTLRALEDQTLANVATFGDFRFVGIQCRLLSGEQIFLSASEHALAKCNPADSIQLRFSAPVDPKSAGEGLTLTEESGTTKAAEGKVEEKDEEKVEESADGKEEVLQEEQAPESTIWDQAYIQTYIESNRQESDSYVIEFYGQFGPWSTFNLSGHTGSLKDIFGRPLADSFKYSFSTDHRPAELKIPGNFAVLEQNVETHLPLYVTNLNKVVGTYSAIDKGDFKEGTINEPLAEVVDVSYPHPLAIRKLVSSGVVYGTLSTEPATASHWFFSQVTPFHVHAKLGHFKSLVWVTDLETGMPVEGAKIDILALRLHEYKGNETVLATATTDTEGKAYLPGSEVLDPAAHLIGQWNSISPVLLVKISHPDGEAVLPASYEFRERERGVSAWTRKKYHHMKTWGATAQGVYRPGDTIQYKLYVRNQDGHSFTPAPQESFELTVSDPAGNNLVEKQEITLNEFGSFAGELTLPENATMGWYQFIVSAPFAEEFSSIAFDVLVTDFTPAPFKARIDIQAKKMVLGEAVKVSTSAALHAGGPYSNAAYRLDASISAGNVDFVPEKYSSFYFQSHEEDEGDRQPVDSSSKSLDGNGEALNELLVNESRIYYGNFNVESSISDDRGKNVATRAKIPFFSKSKFVGVKTEEWAFNRGKTAAVQLIVLNSAGETLQDVPLEVVFEKLERTAAKTKTAGNVYQHHYTTEWKAASICKAVSSLEAVSCAFTPEAAGSYRAIAKIVEEGEGHQSIYHLWVTGPEFVVWDEKGNSIDLEADKESYSPGDVAKILVKNPFPGATALLTTERYGVLDARVLTLSKSVEIIEYMIPADAAPGLYLSLVITSPRVEKPDDTGIIDPGKPAFRQGYVRLPVSEESKRLKFTVDSDRDEYRPGEKASITVALNNSESEPVEFAAIVLDEAVFDLISGGLAAFDPFEGFRGLEALDVANFNLLRQLIGKINYEKKGASPGGGGGAGLKMRSLLKYVSYWNPGLRPDENGKVAFEITLPDNLTAWRMLVMGVTPSDRFGLATGTFKANQPTEIRAALPNQVQKNDEFSARFTLVNRTDRERTIDYSIEVTGAAKPADDQLNTVSGTRVLKPFLRENVELKLLAIEAGEIQLKVVAGDSLDKDGLLVKLPVHDRIESVIFREYLTVNQEEKQIPVAVPTDVAEATTLSLAVSPSLIGNLDPLFESLRDYPYGCWEQRLSKGLAAALAIKLQNHNRQDIWPEAAELVQETIKSASNFQAPNGGMGFYTPENQKVSPYLSAYTALAFQWFKKWGFEPDKAVQSKLEDYLLSLLKEANYPEWYSPDTAAEVIAVSVRALAESGRISETEVTRWKSQVPVMTAFAKAHYLVALSATGAGDPSVSAVQKQLLSHTHSTSGTLRVRENFLPAHAWTLSSDIRSQCAVLESFSSLYGKDAEWQKKLSALVRGTYLKASPNQKEIFRTTQEQLFCLAAMAAYSSAVESGTGTVSYTINHSETKSPLLEGAFESVRDPDTEKSFPFDQAGNGNIKVSADGARPVYARIGLSTETAAMSLEQRNRGIEVVREYSVIRDGLPVKLKSTDAVKRGELVRVDLYIGMPAARYYVVVEDPVAGALEPVNRDLATASRSDAEHENTFAADAYFHQQGGWTGYASGFWSFYHRELGHTAVRFYSEYTGAGYYHLSYVGQAIATGIFNIPPATAEEMYMPEVCGNSTPHELRVQE